MILFPIYSDVFHLIPIYSMANYFSLPGIKRLSYINAKELASDLQAHALSGAPVWITQQQTEIPSGAPVWVTQTQTEIPFTGEASCACTRNNEHGASNESVELTFESLLPIPEHIPLAFIVTDVNNRSYLIGQREQPWPFIESNQGMGMPDGESSTTVYTVTHKGPRAMIPCSCA